MLKSLRSLLYQLSAILNKSLLRLLIISSFFSQADAIHGAHRFTTTIAHTANSPAATVSNHVANSNTAINASNSTSTNTEANNIDDDHVVLNFDNVDIQAVIKAISQLSGKNFVVDPRVKGTVNIVSNQPIAKANSYKVLETALRMQGFATIEANGVIKVLPEMEVKTYGMQQLTGAKKNAGLLGDQVVTKVYVIQHGSAINISNALRPLIAPNNSLSVYPNSNALIVTDYASNIARIDTIISQLSNTEKLTPVIVTLKYAIASDVAQVLQSYLQGGNVSSGGSSGVSHASMGEVISSAMVSITIDPNTNSLILSSPLKDNLEEVRNLALKLDQIIGSNHSDLHVVYLKNADAAHIADVLRVVATGQENPDITASSDLAKFANEPSSMFSSGDSGGGSSGGGGFAGGGSTSGGSNGVTGSHSSNHSSNGSTGGGQNSNNNQNAPKILIQAEPTTNSLIIEAPEAVYHNLRMIIDMLDVRRAEIMIEAMIVDVNTTAAGAFGIQWIVGGGSNNAGALLAANYGGSTNGGASSSLSSIATSVMAATSATSSSAGAAAGGGGVAIPNEVFVGLVTGTTTLGGQTVPTLGALADMIASNSGINILSRPTLLTLDNEEARIMVGENVGIPNGSYQNTAAAPGSVVTTVTRQNIGTFLDIKPLITQSGAIQLDIYQEDSKVDYSAGSIANSTNGPAFLKRNMRTSLIVDDGQIVAIGGMTQDQTSVTKNGIPLLSDIPYLGWLFSWQSRVHSKQNLVLFLRPVIVKTAADYKTFTADRYNYVVNHQKLIQAKGNLLLPRIDPITLDNQMDYSSSMTNANNSKPQVAKINTTINASNNDVNNQSGAYNKHTNDSANGTQLESVSNNSNTPTGANDISSHDATSTTNVTTTATTATTATTTANSNILPVTLDLRKKRTTAP